ncbi:DUF4272 domain-containing protein [Bacillus spongiae]|uniref:DUF4272 domain-containing protein n=1 Tax=Bacillus spongiae TaxID=2683610 RepID=A0ABU8HCG7_9BACI
MELNFIQIKEKSEEIIKEYGVTSNPNLPTIEYQGLRRSEDIISRVTVMAGMVYIAFQAPPAVIREWIHEQRLNQYMTEFEKNILEKDRLEVTPSELLKLKWYLESLWALVWVLDINTNFQPHEPVGNDLLNMVPDVKKKQDFTILQTNNLTRNIKEIYEQTDLYYRLHWYCVDSKLKGIKHFRFDEGTIKERRQALEWVISPKVEWEDIDLST